MANNYFSDNAESRSIARRLSLSRIEDCLRFPKYFELETVNACNARCKMCTVGDWETTSPALMDERLFLKFVDEAESYRDWVECVCLSRDGEPTIDKRLSSWVRTLKNIGIKKVTFSTNAQLLTAALSAELLDAGLDDIMISIDGTTKSVFESIRRRLTFETVVENTLTLAALRKRHANKLNIRVRMVIQEENCHQVDAFLEFWKSRLLSTDDVYAMNCHTWGNQLKNETEDSIQKQATKACISPFSTMVIHANGKVPLCGCDYSNNHLLGDFNVHSIAEIWAGEKYTNIRHLHGNGKRNEIPMCQGCALWDRPVTGRKKDNDRK